MTRIFDNIELNLGGHLVETLSESNRIDAAVGYFNIRGWKLFGDVIHGRSAGGPPIARVLVGMVHGEPEEQVLDHLQRTLEGGPLEDVIDRKTAQARQQQAKLKFRQQLMRGAPTAQDEATIRELRAQLADGRVAIKLFTRRPHLLRVTDITSTDTVTIRLGADPLELPDAIGQLAITAREHRDAPRLLTDAGESDWLFPGQHHGAPLSRDALTDRLARFGIRARHARAGALASLAQELPAPVIARLTGLHVTAATRWAEAVVASNARYSALTR